MPDYRTIPLTKNQVAIVDIGDLLWLEEWRWHTNVGNNRKMYAARTLYLGHRLQVWVMMHRLILDAPDGILVDHINGDGLDNRRSNLRLADHALNNHNRGLQRNNKSGYIGVYASGAGWLAQMRHHGKLHHLGYFATREAAARARDAEAILAFGARACLNFPVDSLVTSGTMEP